MKKILLGIFILSVFAIGAINIFGDGWQLWNPYVSEGQCTGSCYGTWQSGLHSCCHLQANDWGNTGCTYVDIYTNNYRNMTNASCIPPKSKCYGFSPSTYCVDGNDNGSTGWTGWTADDTLTGSYGYWSPGQLSYL